MKVLLVDDSPMQQKIARIYLEKGEGYEVLIANNGREGVELARSNQPDMILLDVEMPEMDGNAALKALKADELTKSIPVIMCTANEEFREEDFLAAGAIGYIKKPHGFSTLKIKLREIFGESH